MHFTASLNDSRATASLLACLLALALCAGCEGGTVNRVDRGVTPEVGTLSDARLLGDQQTGSDARAAGDIDPAGDIAPAGAGLSALYPGDRGLKDDPAVIFAEDFEGGSISAIISRYQDAKNVAGMSLVGDVPKKSSGSAAIKLVAGGSNPSATDFYKSLPGHDELYLRYYAKYESGVLWHHTGVWLTGYNPPQDWPSPQAGLRPDGDDRFSIAIEPMGAGADPGPRMDFYNYWMKMHSWMDQPSGSGAYWGNTLIHQRGFQVQNDRWMCIEIHVKLNPSPSSGAGAELAVWQDDALIQRFTDSAPLGYWLKDKFCPQGADSPTCTDYPPAPGTTLIPLDLQFRTTTDLKLTGLWPQNYITQGGAGAVYYDDLVVATRRIGCIK